MNLNELEAQRHPDGRNKIVANLICDLEQQKNELISEVRSPYSRIKRMELAKKRGDAYSKEDLAGDGDPSIGFLNIRGLISRSKMDYQREFLAHLEGMIAERGDERFLNLTDFEMDQGIDALIEKLFTKTPKHIVDMIDAEGKNHAIVGITNLLTGMQWPSVLSKQMVERISIPDEEGNYPIQTLVPGVAINYFFLPQENEIKDYDKDYDKDNESIPSPSISFRVW